MAERYTVTISRQFGSCGRAVGKEVAKKLGIPFYDRELISLAAKESGISEKIFRNMDEKPTNSLLYSLAVGAYALDNQYMPWSDAAMPLCDQVYLAQTDLIKKLADEGPCVFIGRCSDYVLKDRANTFSIFITDTEQNRVAQIMKDYNITEQKARDMITKTDKKRANYYSFHTNRTWSKGDNYDLCIRTSDLGIEGTAEMIIAFVEKKLGHSLNVTK